MRTLDFYIKKAMEKQGLKSRRQLCIVLGTSHNAINAYDRGSFPSDDTMLKLAELAGIDAMTALTDLHIMRSNGPARNIYIKMAQTLERAAHFVVMFIAFLLISSSGHAAQNVNKVTDYDNASQMPKYILSHNYAPL